MGRDGRFDAKGLMLHAAASSSSSLPSTEPPYRPLSFNETQFLLFIHTSDAGGSALCEVMQSARSLLQRKFGKNHVCLETVAHTSHKLQDARRDAQLSLLAGRYWNPFDAHGNLGDIQQHLRVTNSTAIGLESRNLRFEELDHDCCALPAASLLRHERAVLRHWFLVGASRDPIATTMSTFWKCLSGTCQSNRSLLMPGHEQDWRLSLHQPCNLTFQHLASVLGARWALGNPLCRTYSGAGLKRQLDDADESLAAYFFGRAYQVEPGGIPLFLSDLVAARPGISHAVRGGNKMVNEYKRLAGTVSTMCPRHAVYVRVDKYCLPLHLYQALRRHHDCDYRLLAHGRRMRGNFPGLVNVVTDVEDPESEGVDGELRKITLPPISSYTRLPDGQSLPRCDAVQ